MILFALVSVFIAATTVQIRAAPSLPVPFPAAPPLIPTGIPANIFDFQGNVFDLNDRSAVPLSAISTLNHKPGETAQAASTILTMFKPCPLFGMMPPDHRTSSLGHSIQRLQPRLGHISLVHDGHQRGERGYDAGLRATGPNGVEYYCQCQWAWVQMDVNSIIETVSQRAVMSWLHSNSPIVTPTTPLTLELFDPKEPQQIFNFTIVQMNHPYSGTASYIYANEHPYTPVDPRAKNPYSNLPSFIPSPSITSNSSPRRSHDSGWSREGTYTRTQRPKHDSVDAPHLQRGLSQPRPLIPFHAPISHPYQQRAAAASWVHKPADATFIRSQGRSTSLPGHSRPPNMKMTPYGSDGDPLSLRKSAFMPYEPDQRTVETSRSWRTKIQAPSARNTAAQAVDALQS
ncbi:hypothetical protein B0H19DRAFT_1375693 [Mycena capillaripes]|nr:hypothetical protein B0H19DRAFT_1375693 [Mycena capillaripes]